MPKEEAAQNKQVPKIFKWIFHNQIMKMYHSSWIVMVSMNTKDGQAYIEVGILIIYMTKPVGRK